MRREVLSRLAIMMVLGIYGLRYDARNICL